MRVDLEKVQMTSHHVNRYVIKSIRCTQKRWNQKRRFVICLVTNIVALVFNAKASPSTYPSQSVSLQIFRFAFLQQLLALSTAFLPFTKCQNQLGQGVPAIWTMLKRKCVFFSDVVSHL